MVLNDYQKRLIAEGFHSRWKQESNSDKRIQMILEFMDSFMPKDSFPILREGAELERSKNNFSLY